MALPCPAAARSTRGLTVIELVVAMVLGLLILGGVITLFLSNRQAFRTTEQLSRVQETARTAFELMARSVREAGAVPCGKDLPVANVLNGAATTWWADWGAGIRGHDDATVSPIRPFGTAAGQRVQDTDAFTVMYGQGDPAVSVAIHVAPSAVLGLSTPQHGFSAGDVLMVCDFRQASIFQVTTAAAGSNPQVVHDTGGSISPGNCSRQLGGAGNCAPGAPPHTYPPGSQVVRLVAEGWYVGHNTSGGRSLYRSRLQTGAGGSAGAGPVAQEIAEGISDMQVEYLLDDGSGGLASDYQPASSIASTDWSRVVAARIAFQLQGNARVGTDGEVLTRTSVHVVSLRNRLP